MPSPPVLLLSSPPFSLCGIVLLPFDSLIPLCRRLYVFPSLVSILIRPFHVASNAPLHPILKIKAPLSLKQRIFVRRARVSDLYRPFLDFTHALYVPSLQMCSPLRPSPHLRPPSPYRVAPLGVEATYHRPPSKGKRFLLTFFSTLLMHFSGPPRSQRVPSSPYALYAIPPSMLALSPTP